MAKYDDYVTRRDGGTSQNLETELADARANTTSRQQASFSMPERFENKSPEDIATSYVELEKKFSQQGNDLGQMRRTVDQLIALQSQPREVQEEDLEPITTDDLYLDPQAAISRVTRETVSPQLNVFEKELNDMKMRFVEQDLTVRYPTWREDTQTEEFKEWVQAKPYRSRLAIAAGQRDNEAAEELLSMYEDSRTNSREAVKQERKRDLSNASLERGSSARHTTKSGGDLFSRSELMLQKIAAKQGSDKAERWLRENSEAIQMAYSEGRVVD